MSKARYQKLSQRIRESLKAPGKRTALYNAMKRGRDSRATAFSVLPGSDEFRARVHEIKKRSIANLPELVHQFTASARKRGANVLLAKDGKEAIEYILQITLSKEAKTVAKSKSLTSEEIEVNHPMQKAGMQVIETDLGELIIQFVNEKPFHLVFPAVHKTLPEVAEIFERELQQTVPHDVNEIMRIVRKYLRPIFLDADIGMTGANVGIAENGAIVIETNEGNARLVSSIPNTHICIMGIEKVVATVEDALKMVLAHPISAVGQFLTTYVTFMAGRSPLDGQEASRETHIILLDNGRSEMREDPKFSEALHCIRCGACMNICPTYGVVGGHTFGHIYPGPIGIPWTARVHGLENAGDFAHLCISCGLCKEICPAEIDIPMMIAEVKHQDSQQHPHPYTNELLMKAEWMAKMGSRTAPISNWSLRNPIFRYLLEKIAGIDRRRTIPPFNRYTLDKWLSQRTPLPSSTEKKRKVAYFVDIYANYNDSSLGIAVIELLEKYGCEVIVPTQKSCGYPFIGYGDMDRAKEIADYNVMQFAPYVEEGYDIVTTEPTAAYCMKLAYPKLLDHRQDSENVAEKTYELFDYLILLEDENSRPAIEPCTLRGRKFGFHLPCHQRPLSSGKSTIDWLRRQGAEIVLIETGTCCGMAGTFGMKKGALGYELANAVGEPLFTQFIDAQIEAIVTESSVCSIHLFDGTGIPVYHPLKLIQEME